MRGRPIRFLAVTLGGWVGARVVLLLPVAVPVKAAIDAFGPAKAFAATAPFVTGLSRNTRGDARAAMSASAWVAALPPAPAAIGFAAPLIAAGPTSFPSQAAPSPAVTALPPPLVPTPRGGSRLAGSAWLIARGGASAGLLGGQLGASQAGVRVTYALGAGRRVALSARLAAPLRGMGREAAVGIDWQPFGAPLHVIAEHRVALDGGRGGPTAMLVGGIGPVEVAPGVRLEAYAQAGAIARGGVEAFADGAMRVTHPLATLGGWRIDVGAGAWGGAQRGASRLDVGPTLGVTVPVGGRSLRLTADWRQRIAGDARPGSGPALTLGSDF